MVFSIFLYSLLHETGERREHVDGRVDLFVVELPVDEDLSLSNVASEVGDGVGDIVVLAKQQCTGIDKMGIWVIEPFLPCTLPALS